MDMGWVWIYANLTKHTHTGSHSSMGCAYWWLCFKVTETTYSWSPFSISLLDLCLLELDRVHTQLPAVHQNLHLGTSSRVSSRSSCPRYPGVDCVSLHFALRPQFSNESMESHWLSMGPAILILRTAVIISKLFKTLVSKPEYPVVRSYKMLCFSIKIFYLDVLCTISQSLQIHLVFSSGS